MRKIKDNIKYLLGIPVPKLYKKDDPWISNILKRKDFPYFISFPRTGSHWLRHIIELYFRKPLLLRTFYYGNKTDFLLYHTHDLTPDNQIDHEESSKYIYLYRDPADTIYSQMRYHYENVFDKDSITFWTLLYVRHIQKWAIENSKNSVSSMIRYERLRSNPIEEFRKITDFFKFPLDEQRVRKIIQQVSYQKVGELTSDKKVINASHDYKMMKDQFCERNAPLIREIIVKANSEVGVFLYGK